MIRDTRKSPFLIYSALLSPFIIIYLWLFALSMDTALDRHNYLRIMNVNIPTRIEPMLTFISYLLEFFTDNGVIKLIIIQTFFISLLCTAIYKYIKPKDLNSFSQCLIAFLFIILVFSSALGVQLRIGYAIVLLTYFIVTFKKINLIILLPILMHYGSLFGVLFYFYILIFKIDNNRKFIVHSVFILFALTILFTNIEYIFNLIGIRGYYYAYLNSEADFGRAIPYTSIFYLILSTYIVLFIKDNSSYRYFCLSGLWLLYVGFVLDFYLAFKMMSPMSFFTIIYTMKHIPKNRHALMRVLIVYMLMPIVFIYYAYQVKII